MFVDLNYKDLLYDNEEQYIIDTEYMERIDNFIAKILK